MKQALAILSLLILLLSCKKDFEAETGEVEASVTGYVIADYWTKGCSSGGLEIKIGNNTYVVSNSISPAYEEPNAWPIPVWVRYELAPPDSCSQSTNRVKILSIRKKS